MTKEIGNRVFLKHGISSLVLLSQKNKKWMFPIEKQFSVEANAQWLIRLVSITGQIFCQAIRRHKERSVRM